MILNVNGNCIKWVYNKRLIQFEYMHVQNNLIRKKTKLMKTGILNIMKLSLEKKQKTNQAKKAIQVTIR
jgi:hypothetical protein